MGVFLLNPPSLMPVGHFAFPSLFKREGIASDKNKNPLLKREGMFSLQSRLNEGGFPYVTFSLF